MGSLREDYCSLLSFAVCLGLLIAVEWAVGVAAFAVANKSGAGPLAANMKRSMQQYAQQDEQQLTKGEREPHQIWKFNQDPISTPSSLETTFLLSCFSVGRPPDRL